MRFALPALLCLGVLCAPWGGAQAASVVTNEADLDAIFSQQAFTDAGYPGGFDVRFVEQITIADPGFLDVDDLTVSFDVDSDNDGVTDFSTTGNEMDALLYGQIPGLTETDRIYMMYVDTVSVCGSQMDARIVGCALVPGNRQVIESSFADGSFGAELMAHEIVHNLGYLPHREDIGDPPGLMSETLNNNTTLNTVEIETIMRSDLLVLDAILGVPVLTVQPVLFVGSLPTTIPLPPAGVALAAALGALALRRRRG